MCVCVYVCVYVMCVYVCEWYLLYTNDIHNHLIQSIMYIRRNADSITLGSDIATVSFPMNGSISLLIKKKKTFIVALMNFLQTLLVLILESLFVLKGIPQLRSTCTSIIITHPFCLCY